MSIGKVPAAKLDPAAFREKESLGLEGLQVFAGQGRRSGEPSIS